MRIIVDQTEGVHEWRPVGDRLRVSVDVNKYSTKKVLKTLKKRFKEDHVEVKILRLAKPTMEDVFVYMVQNQRDEK